MMITFTVRNTVHRFSARCIRSMKRCFHHYDQNHLKKQSLSHPSEDSCWKPVIGLEIHAQLNSMSKLFSNAPNKFLSSPNSLVSNFDVSAPGTLPALNRKCVENAIKAAIALNCKINKKSYFDRKHYFYADMPQGYQITQQHRPIAEDGHLEYTTLDGNQVKRVDIKQVQLEQDSGKSLHLERQFTLIDLNRAGVGLIEIVTAPDLTNINDTIAFVKELYCILKHINTCDGKLSEGQFRVDVNISLRKEGESFGTRAEVKNLGSFKSIHQALEYEIKRQSEVLDQGGMISQETRAFDPEKEITVSMREKEGRQDYRFMPEPNLPPLYLSDDITAGSFKDLINIDDLRRKMPPLPASIRQALMEQYNLSYYQAAFLVERSLDEYFSSVMTQEPQLSSFIVFEWIRIRIVAHMDKSNLTSADECFVSASQLADLLVLLHNLEINESIADEVFERALIEGKPPAMIVEENCLKMITDIDVIDELCADAIETLGKTNKNMYKKYEVGNPKNKYNKKIFTKVIRLLMERTNNKIHTKVAKQRVLRLLDKRMSS